MKSFMNKKQGYTLIEVIIVVIIIRIISSVIVASLWKRVDDAKIAVIKNTLEEHMSYLKIDFLKNGKLDDLNNDGNYLDDLILNNKVEDLNRKNFESPSTVKYEIRQLAENPDKIAVYIVLEATHSKDKYLIDEAVKRLKLTDNNYYKETF